jgi:hypothetical protein
MLEVLNKPGLEDIALGGVNNMLLGNGMRNDLMWSISCIVVNTTPNV